MANAKTTTKTATPAADMMQAMQGGGFEALPVFGTNWFEMATDMGRAMSTFTAARLKEDAETQNALMHAKGIAEVQQIQTQYFQKAMADYSAEMAKLMEMMTTAAPTNHKHATPV